MVNETTARIEIIRAGEGQNKCAWCLMWVICSLNVNVCCPLNYQQDEMQLSCWRIKNLDTIQNKVLLKTVYRNQTSKFRENETVAIWKNVCQISWILNLGCVPSCSWKFWGNVGSKPQVDHLLFVVYDGEAKSQTAFYLLGIWQMRVSKWLEKERFWRLSATCKKK